MVCSLCPVRQTAQRILAFPVCFPSVRARRGVPSYRRRPAGSFSCSRRSRGLRRGTAQAVSSSRHSEGRRSRSARGTLAFCFVFFFLRAHGHAPSFFRQVFQPPLFSTLNPKPHTLSSHSLLLSYLATTALYSLWPTFFHPQAVPDAPSSLPPGPSLSQARSRKAKPNGSRWFFLPVPPAPSFRGPTFLVGQRNLGVSSLLF